MHSDLAQILSELKERHFKLVLLVGINPQERSSLLAQWANDCLTSVTQLGRALSPRLAELSVRSRPLEVSGALEELAKEVTTDELLFLDGLEVLFDDSLKIDPFDTLKRLSLRRLVFAVWPGDYLRGRLTYAKVGHPEFRDCAPEGVLLYPRSPLQDMQ
ncbi:MAG: BREX-3 system P-loop-containing protein BrxF [Fibrobacterota bacterium]|nr:MAG: BREX-3 system P-loop-containing protein BrxF [Fibrobacterota bacterium]